MGVDTDPQKAFGHLYLASAPEVPQNHNTPSCRQGFGDTADCFRACLQELPEAVIIIDRHQGIVFVNAQAERVLTSNTACGGHGMPYPSPGAISSTTSV